MSTSDGGSVSGTLDGASSEATSGEDSSDEWTLTYDLGPGMSVAERSRADSEPTIVVQQVQIA